ncbi:hypothetical protein B0H14DRAFT_3867288 [Mycena olivaceomarginata]|nr:hypothetical protein B0H14DRAFT_3867288 [Mycena olivaceomarginata]
MVHSSPVLVQTARNAQSLNGRMSSSWSLQYFGPDEATKPGNVGNSNAVFEQYRQDMCVLVDKDLVALMHLCPLAGYLRTHGAPHLESLCLMWCDACAAHAPGALPLHPHVAQLSVPQLMRLLSTAPSLARLVLNGSNPTLPDPPDSAPTPARPQPRPGAPAPHVRRAGTSTAAGLATLDALATPRVFAPFAHLELVSANPVALAIEATKTVCVRGSPGVFALGAGAVGHAATGVALQALVGAALGAWRQRDTLTAAGVYTLMRLVGADPAALAIEATGTVCVCAGAPGCLQLERGAGAVDPAATGAALWALETVCVCGSPGPFALGAGADVGTVDPAATGAMLQTLVGAHRCAAQCVEAVYAGAAHAHHGVPEQYILGAMHVLVFRRAEGDADGDRDTVHV